MDKNLYLGLYLSGLKKDKSSLIVLENYKGQKRLVISKITSSFKGGAATKLGKSDSDLNALPDELLIEEIKSYNKPVCIGVNFPTYMPPAWYCKSSCKSLRDCNNLEIKTLFREYKKRTKLTAKSKKIQPFPSPYIERGIDYYVAYLLEESFPFEPAFSTNRATLLARGQFLKKSFKSIDYIECSTKASLWRIGRSYKIGKGVLRNFYKSPSKDHLELFLKKLEKDFFIYEEDKEMFIEDKSSFEALICALSAFYYKAKKSEKIPVSFLPKSQHFSLPNFD